MIKNLFHMILSRKKTLQMSTNIVIQKYAERHYLKNFKRKYKSARDPTYTSICLMIDRIDKYLQTSLVEKFVSHGDSCILKVEFRIAWSNVSPHASGNRAIIHRDKRENLFDLLLIYMKTDIPKKMWETVRRKQTVKDKYQKTFSCCWDL